SWKEIRIRSPDRLLGFPSGFPLGMVPPKNLDERNNLFPHDSVLTIQNSLRHQVTHKECHLHAVKRIFRYLKGHPKLGLWYPESPFDLVAYSYSEYGGATQDHKSTTGGCQFLGRRLISWQCKKQTIVATSTTEAEYVAAASCYGQVLWIQNQLLDYGHHFIRDCFEKKLISVDHIHTDENVADLLTKPFDAGRFRYFVVIGTSKYWGILRILMISLRLIPLTFDLVWMWLGGDYGNVFLMGFKWDPVVNMCINSLHGSDSEQRTHEFIYIYLASACVYVWIGNKIMARLQFCDYHNMVAILEKSEHNVDFHPIVDFVEASPLSVYCWNLKDKSMWSDQEKRVQKINHQARSLLIQGLLNDIYSLIDSNKTAKDLWDGLTRHMLGSEYGEQDRKATVLYEYEKFKATEGELLLDTYIRYLQVINDLKKYGYSKDNCELNFKFLNNLQPEWKQYAKMMRQNKNLMDINIDALYNILKEM
nr:hypothetical protein [Tanacetum cinerariifolium]